MDRRWVAVAALGLMLGIGGCSASTGPSTPDAPAPPTSVSALSPTVVAEPTRIEIPAIGLGANLIQTGQTSPGVLEVPERLAVPSWWRDSARPGQLGPAVILGHTSPPGKAGGVFDRLGELEPGDTIRVVSADRARTFVVQRVDQVPKTAFPADVTEPSGPTLRLVTCGGRFDTSTGHRTDNVIVYADEKEEPT
jgi:sortase (surface protein transpeptidase)